ncbi:hypothetical protein Vadar_012982 [Vaccinium darrowii]|uniref:Uncharacterized protein n=1 Tax=Vaccinium darrowii TaxID=229202 RepID=A0ACB7YL96_9ERIC|nr:hypothetical protein Vadar_012982 [Vaccinium darrowii]
MSTTSGLSKLGQALSVIFVVSLLALVAELFYVLWRRRFFRRQSTATDGSDAAPLRSSFPTSKELLYLLCWKQHQSRVEPDGGGGGGSDPETGCNGQSSSVEDPTDEVIDILKLQAMRGPSRVLFTIQEEEREDGESSEAEQSVSSASAEKSHEKRRRVSQLSLEECFNIDGDLTEEEEVVTVTLVGNCGCEIETPPYSTPCGSPSYYTPSASPIRGF